MIRHVRLAGAALCLLALTLLSSAASEAADPTAPPDPSDGLSQQISPDQEVGDGRAVLSQGHVDLGPRYLDGSWSLMIHDDTQLRGSVWRPLDKVAIKVNDSAVQTVPDDSAYDFLGVDPGAAVHVVPQTQDPDVVWLGWNTQDPAVMESVDRGVTLSLTGVDGPGELLVYLQDGGFGAPDVLWDSRSREEQALWVDVNTHTHANWVFTEPGVYLVHITAAAQLVGGAEERTTDTLRIAVGDGTDPAEALDATVPTQPAEGADDVEQSTEPGSGQDSDGLSVAVPLGVGAAVLAVALALVVVRGRRVRVRAGAGEPE